MKYIKYGHGKWVKDRYGATESTFRAYVTSGPRGLSEFYKFLLDNGNYFAELQKAVNLLKNKK